MAARHISQREARRMRKRIAELESQNDARRERWVSEWPGTPIDTISVSEAEWHIVKTARALMCAVVVVPTDGRQLRVYADTLR